MTEGNPVGLSTIVGPADLPAALPRRQAGLLWQAGAGKWNCRIIINQT